MPPSSLADLFDPAPSQWGLRGDPLLWQALRDNLGSCPLPENAAALQQLLQQHFANLAGVPLSHPQDVFVEQFDHATGMSSGYVSPAFWRDIALPLLLSRYAGT